MELASLPPAQRSPADRMLNVHSTGADPRGGRSTRLQHPLPPLPPSNQSSMIAGPLDSRPHTWQGWHAAPAPYIPPRIQPKAGRCQPFLLSPRHSPPVLLPGLPFSRAPHLELGLPQRHRNPLIWRRCYPSPEPAPAPALPSLSRLAPGKDPGGQRVHTLQLDPLTHLCSITRCPSAAPLLRAAGPWLSTCVHSPAAIPALQAESAPRETGVVPRFV